MCLFFAALTKLKVADSESESEDFSGEESDFVPDSSSSDEDVANLSVDDKSDEETEAAASSSKRQPIVMSHTVPTGRGRRKQSQQDFVLESDGYFSHHVNKLVLN